MNNESREQVGFKVTLGEWPKPSPVLTAPTHGGTARLSGPGQITGTADPPKPITNPGTNRARRSSTMLMRPAPLPQLADPEILTGEDAEDNISACRHLSQMHTTNYMPFVYTKKAAF